MESLAQEIANDLVSLAHHVRTDPSDARSYVGDIEHIGAKIRRLYEIVGEP